MIQRAIKPKDMIQAGIVFGLLLVLSLLSEPSFRLVEFIPLFS